MKRETGLFPALRLVCRRYGVIPVDRSGGRRALREMMALGKAAIADHRPIVIFPEGTRVPNGQQPDLRSGFAGMYRMLGLPVVPVRGRQRSLVAGRVRKTRQVSSISRSARPSRPASSVPRSNPAFTRP